MPDRDSESGDRDTAHGTFPDTFGLLHLARAGLSRRLWRSGWQRPSGGQCRPSLLPGSPGRCEGGTGYGLSPRGRAGTVRDPGAAQREELGGGEAGLDLSAGIGTGAPREWGCPVFRALERMQGQSRGGSGTPPRRRRAAGLWVWQ